MPGKHPEAGKKGYCCSSCQWFTVGYAGNCQTLRGVSIDTPACIEYLQPQVDEFAEIMIDKYLVGLRESFKHPMFKLDDSLAAELTGYLLDEDLSSKQMGTLQDLTRINEMLRKILAYRARVSNIYTSLIDIKHELDERINYANLWLFAKHKVYKDLKNAVARKAAFDRIMPEAMPIKKTISKLEVTAKYVDDRLDANERLLCKILASAERIKFSQGGRM